MIWQDILNRLQNATAAQLQQPVQVLKMHPDESVTIALLPGIGLDTIGNYEIPRVRSSVDNKYHAEDLVLLVDENMFAEDGVFCYRLEDGEEIPEYSKYGKTDPADQRKPESNTGV